MKRLIVALATLVISGSPASQDSWRISTRGYGAVRAGMSVAEASKVLQSELQTEDGQAPEPECDYVYPKTGHKGVAFMVQRGIITHALITDPAIRTLSGLRIGASTAELRKAYGQRLKIEPHQYDETGFYYFVWEPDGRHGIKFEVSGDHVTDIYAGDKTIQYVEGCL